MKKNVLSLVCGFFAAACMLFFSCSDYWENFSYNAGKDGKGGWGPGTPVYFTSGGVQKFNQKIKALTSATYIMFCSDADYFPSEWSITDFSDCFSREVICAIDSYGDARIAPRQGSGYFVFPADCSGLLKGCTQVQIFEVGYSAVSGIQNTTSMFEGCTSLQSVLFRPTRGDPDGENRPAGVTACSKMFKGCSALHNISIIADWSSLPSSSCTDMFEGCTHMYLKYYGEGYSDTYVGDGPHYDPAKIDNTYAKVGTSASNPGYFSR